MSTANLLVELFVEELPPKALKRLGDSFAQLIADSLRAQGLAGDGAVTPFASPRRLGVHIAGVAAKAADKAVRSQTVTLRGVRQRNAESVFTSGLQVCRRTAPRTRASSSGIRCLPFCGCSPRSHSFGITENTGCAHGRAGMQDAPAGTARGVLCACKGRPGGPALDLPRARISGR